MSKVIIKPSLSSLNSIDVTIDEESHSVASPLVERMNMDSNCVFAAYKIAHPADDFVSLKIQGNEFRNAKDILETGLRSIITDLEDLIAQVKKIE
jgi:DNA-directed RNA polymerase subunit L